MTVEISRRNKPETYVFRHIRKDHYSSYGLRWRSKTSQTDASLCTSLPTRPHKSIVNLVTLNETPDRNFRLTLAAKINFWKVKITTFPIEPHIHRSCPVKMPSVEGRGGKDGCDFSSFVFTAENLSAPLQAGRKQKLVRRDTLLSFLYDNM